MAHSGGDLAALGPDGKTVICNRRWDDGHVCREVLASIPERWYLLGDLWAHVDPERNPRGAGTLGHMEARRTGTESTGRKFTGTERVLFFADGYEEEEYAADHFALTAHARANVGYGRAPSFRRRAMHRPSAQGGPLPVRSPWGYPAWARCPQCHGVRLLDRHALDVVTLAEAAGH